LTLGVWNLEPNASTVSTLCGEDRNLSKRIGCCKPLDTRYLWNVKLKADSIEVYGAPIDQALGSLDSPQCSTEKQWATRGNCSLRFAPGDKLPKVKDQFWLPVVHRPGPLSRAEHCPGGFFDGTLYVIGLSTTSNIFHALADNMLNLLSTVVTERVSASQAAAAPAAATRVPALQGGQRALRIALPHWDLLGHALAGGEVSLEHAAETCYRRIIWGQGECLPLSLPSTANVWPGPSLLYEDLMVALRRQTVLLLCTLAFTTLRLPLAPRRVRWTQSAAPRAQQRAPTVPRSVPSWRAGAGCCVSSRWT
jgi:hypothetical protein